MFTKIGEIRFIESSWSEYVFQDIYYDSDSGQIRFDRMNNTYSVQEYRIYATGLTSPLSLVAPNAQTYGFTFGDSEATYLTIYPYDIPANSILQYLLDNEQTVTSTLTTINIPEEFDVVVTLENMTASYGITVTEGATLLISNIIPNSGYIPPTSVTVTVGGVPRASGVGYEYVKAYGSIPGSLSIPTIDGDVAVTISGVLGETFDIAYNLSPELAGLPNFTPTKNYEGDSVVIKIYSQNNLYKVPDDVVLVMNSSTLIKDTDYSYTIVSGIATIELPLLTDDLSLSATSVLKDITNVTYTP